MLEMSVRVGALPYLRQNRAVIKRNDLRRVLPGIVTPTAVIVGAEDKLTPLRLSQEIHRLTPRSTLNIIPDCGHLPPIEKPQILAEILLELLQQN